MGRDPTRGGLPGRTASELGPRSHRPPRLEPPPQGWVKRWSVNVLASVGALTAILGAIGAVISFLPSIKVEVMFPGETKDAYSAVFFITNENLVPINDVEIGVILCVVLPDMIGPPLEGPKCGYRDASKRIEVSEPNWQGLTIGKGEKFTVSLGDFLYVRGGGGIRYADIAVAVHYNPWFLPFRREAIFRFVTRTLPDGKTYWFPSPVQ